MPEQRCHWCGEAISPERQAKGAVFCRKECKQLWHAEAVRKGRVELRKESEAGYYPAPAKGKKG